MIKEILTNEIILSSVISVILAQFIKMVGTWKRTGKVDFTKLYETGGMPSSHAAFVAALVVSVFFVEGFSTISLVALAFSIIVIRDALGIRYEAGEQAKIINKIIKDLKMEKRLHISRLRELVGHTATQVQAGLLLGGIFAVMIHYILLL